ncbi:MAG: CDP-glycerol glycerophosphotransferase family protein, partial [Clostridia bacterium]|nr:CDP-glycerol glycerophosphotransferase family protein [Clostridia bacterium]
LKRMGRDQLGNDVADFFCPNTTMVLGNRFTLDIMKHLTFGKIPMQLLGTPRNDILFSSTENVRELKEKLGLPQDKKIILYAPTFRNDGKDTEGKNVLRSGINQINEIDFNGLFESLGKRFGGEWVFIGRFHYHVEQMVDWEALNKKYNGKIINGNAHDDMAEYLVCADVLLTDASSCMFDYALTRKPCLIYFPDLENYGSKERGFYIGVDELPFPVSKTGGELISAVDSFNGEKYLADVEKMFSDFGYADDENSSERVVKYILGEQK